PSSSSSYEEKKKEEMFSFNFHLDSEWILLFLDSAPAVLFFSSLSLIVLFWAKIYYAA
ncbi:transmembrane, partial [Cystoisospora suis]